jgi:hypothetical protein
MLACEPVRLDVGVLGAEELFGALDGDGLDDVVGPQPPWYLFPGYPRRICS